MNKILSYLIVAALLVFGSTPAYAAGSVTVTSSTVRDGSTQYAKYSIAWTSDAAGAVSGHAFSVSTGRLASVRFVPSTGGTQPTNLYDATITDGQVLDLTSGQGTDLSNSAAKIYQWNPALYQDATLQLDLVIANAGNAKTGTVVLLIQTR